MKGRLLSAIVFLLLPLSTVTAHPVARKAHDRTILVRLTPEAVLVDYHLEIDDWTVVFVDLPAVSDRDELGKLVKPEDYYEAFTRSYAPILADNLTARVDGKPLTFRCVRHGHTMADHLRCDFRFEAKWQPRPGARHEFTFHEGNYELESGMLRLSLTNGPDLPFMNKTEPEKELQARAATELRPGDDERLRSAVATIDLPDVRKVGTAGPVGTAKPDHAQAGSEATPKAYLKPPAAAAAATLKTEPSPESAHR